MKVVVSNTFSDETYTQFIAVKTMQEVVDRARKSSSNLPELVVYNDSDEDQLQVCRLITELYKLGCKRFYYIAETPKSAIVLSMTGVSGTLITESFYLADEADLLSVTEEQVTDLTTADSNIDVVVNFIDAFSRGDERVNQPMVIEQAKNALSALQAEVKLNTEALQLVGDGAIQTFEQIANYYSEVQGLQVKLQEQVDALQAQIKDTKRVPTTLEGTINKFNQFAYNTHNRILYFREVAKMPYFAGFTHLYKQYLERSANKTVKLIYLISKEPTAMQRMMDLDPNASIIQQGSQGIGSLYSNSVVITDVPTKDVVSKLLSSDEQLFIVVDRVHQKEPLMTGRFKTLNAISGNSDVARFKLKGSQTMAMASTVSPDSDIFLKLPTFRLGEGDIANKLMRAYKEYFQKLNNYFDI